MSLRAFLMRAEVQQLYRDTFPTMPDQPPMPPMAAVSQTTNASAVGTAFDYLLRFYVRHLNPDAVVRRWVAEAGVNHAWLTVDEATNARLESIIRTAKAAEAAIQEHGVIRPEHAAAALALAPLDAIFRTKRFSPTWLVEPAAADIDDLMTLAELLHHQDWLVASRVCRLNCTFGKASLAIGGADCDLIVDGLLVDIKTTVEGRMRPADLRQILAYWALSTMDPDCPAIDTVGVYGARHGVLTSIPLAELASPAALQAFLTGFGELMAIGATQAVAPRV